MLPIFSLIDLFEFRLCTLRCKTNSFECWTCFLVAFHVRFKAFDWHWISEGWRKIAMDRNPFRDDTSISDDELYTCWNRKLIICFDEKSMKIRIIFDKYLQNEHHDQQHVNRMRLKMVAWWRCSQNKIYLCHFLPFGHLRSF